MKDNELINEKVIHKVYGEGIVKSVEEGYIDVEFKNGNNSKFQIPSCFDKFLKLADESKQHEMDDNVVEWKKANGIFEKEVIRQKTMATQAGIKKRSEERELRRIKRAKEIAERNRMFMNK
ncbi:MAG: hypothetical protein Q4D29_04480 [Lachnospiraceae bacterium]|nr:hypothetical protein [Lachnospiraceae bacterium]